MIENHIKNSDGQLAEIRNQMENYEDEHRTLKRVVNATTKNRVRTFDSDCRYTDISPSSHK